MLKNLVNEKGYAKKNVLVDPPIQVTFKGEPYFSNFDLVVRDREIEKDETEDVANFILNCSKSIYKNVYL